MIETDHDMRNPADMLILERVGQGSAAHTGHLSGAIDHAAPRRADHAQLHTVSDQREQCQPDHEPALPAGPSPDLMKQAADINNTINILRQQLTLQQASADATNEGRPRRSTTPSRSVNDLRDKLANFDDSSGRYATTSTGSRTVSTSPLAQH